MPRNVTHIAVASGDATRWTPAAALDHAQGIIDRGEFTGTKAVVLLLDDAAGGYDWTFLQAGTSTVDLIALLHVALSHATDQHRGG